MKFLSHLLRAGYFLVLIELINSYLLIAANLNDFRTIAEKLVPEDIANRLSKVVSDSALGKVSETSDENKDYQGTDRLLNKNIKVKAYEKPKVSLDIKGTKVDFDELVERVRKRLENELKQKYIVKKQNSKEIKTGMNKKEYAIKTNNKSDKSKSNNHYKFTSPAPQSETVEEEEAYENLNYEVVTKKPNKIVQKEIKFAKDERSDYADSMADFKVEKVKRIDNKEKAEKIYYDYEIAPEGDVYKKINIVKKDSYEDYKIPEKVNIYSSSEKNNNKRFKIENRQKNTKKNKYGFKDYVSHPIISEEIAGVTEDILNDYNDTEIITDEMVIKKKNKASDKKFHTMIPKRQLYSIITPNYLKNVPNVAEKYNFNEPIPERDQEREDSKYYGNPPASVNKKVRLL